MDSLLSLPIVAKIFSRHTVIAAAGFVLGIMMSAALGFVFALISFFLLFLL